MRFVYDVALFAQCIENLQKMVLYLTEINGKARLKINAKKAVPLLKMDEGTDIGLELTIKGEKSKGWKQLYILDKH